jgi:hypothetical protein
LGLGLVTFLFQEQVMKNAGRFALAAGALAMSQAAFGEVVYEVPGPPAGSSLGFTQQNGNAAYEYGEAATLLTATPQKLDRIGVDFGFFSYEAASHTPFLQLDVYQTDALGNVQDSNPLDTLAYTPIAQAFNNTTVFSGSNYNAGGFTRSTEQRVFFDFTAQNLTLPTHYAFAYRDNNPAGNVNPGFGFSVFLSGDNSIDPDGTGKGFIQATPNDPSGATVTFGAPQSGGHIEGIVETTPVPEPVSLGLLGLGAGALFARRRRA